MISVAAPRLRAALPCQDRGNPCEQSSSAPLCESEHAEGGSVLSTVKRVRECGPTCRITQKRRKKRAAELRIWREEVARVAPEPKDRDTFGGVDAPCLVSRSDVFPSLMQGCHWGSDPETGGNGSHGAVHSTPPGRSKPVQKTERSIEGRGVSEAVRSMPQHKALTKFTVYQTHLPPAS